MALPPPPPPPPGPGPPPPPPPSAEGRPAPARADNDAAQIRKLLAEHRKLERSLRAGYTVYLSAAERRLMPTDYPDMLDLTNRGHAVALVGPGARFTKAELLALYAESQALTDAVAASKRAGDAVAAWRDQRRAGDTDDRAALAALQPLVDAQRDAVQHVQELSAQFRTRLYDLRFAKLGLPPPPAGEAAAEGLLAASAQGRANAAASLLAALAKGNRQVADDADGDGDEIPDAAEPPAAAQPAAAASGAPDADGDADPAASAAVGPGGGRAGTGGDPKVFPEGGAAWIAKPIGWFKDAVPDPARHTVPQFVRWVADMLDDPHYGPALHAFVDRVDGWRAGAYGRIHAAAVRSNVASYQKAFRGSLPERARLRDEPVPAPSPRPPSRLRPPALYPTARRPAHEPSDSV